MTWPIRLIVAVLVLLVGAGVFFLPPATEPLIITSSLPVGPRGAIHVHTRRSDGTGTLDDVAAAANRAGLQFVVVTDHGDATREPEPAAYRQGVLMIDAVEVSTTGGHVLALGLGVAPYPLAGEPRDVVEDIKRLGGIAIAAHPDSAKPDLRWTDSTVAVDGLEWLNGDSEWRDEPASALARALLTYFVRPPQTLARLLDRPAASLARFDAMARERRVVTVAGSDAHARIGLRDESDPYAGATALRLPGYEQVFRTFAIVLPGARLAGSAEADARVVLSEIAAGHVYSSIDGLATPAALRMTARSGTSTASPGDVLPIEGPVTIRVDTNAHVGSIALFAGGVEVASGAAPSLEYDAPSARAAYRAEVTLPGAPGSPPVPWMVSNPIYVGGVPTLEATPEVAGEGWPQYVDGPATGWAVEKSEKSMGEFEVIAAVDGTQISWRFALGGTKGGAPYVALRVPPAPQLAAASRLALSVRAATPMRFSVQLRRPDGQRWTRSVYVDETLREVVVPFAEFRAAGGGTAGPPPLDQVDALLLVVDSVNTALGRGGQIWLDDLRLVE